jgi:hypothetical protein
LVFNPLPKGHMKILWVPPDEDEPQEKKMIPPIPETADGRKFIGSGEDAHVYANDGDY